MQLAIVCNSLPPYRVHFHRRIACELPDVTLHTLVTHDDSRWPNRMIPEINTVMFGEQDALAGSGIRGINRNYGISGKIIAYLKEHQIDTVIINGYNDLGRLRLIRWCKKNGVRAFLWSDSNVHGDNAAGLKRIVKKAVVSRVVKACTGILVCGQYGRQYYEPYGAKPEQITYIPYEPDYSVIESISPAEIEEVKANHNLNGDGPRILFCGRFVDAKKPDLVIEAFNAVAAKNPTASLVMVGQGPLEQDLRSLVDPAFKDRVNWTGFIKHEREMSAIFRSCDIMVLPSAYEPWALVVNEAAAAGLAIIASNVVGAAPELIDPQKNGALVPPNDLLALTQSLEKIISDPETLNSFKAGSRQVLNTWRTKADPIAGVASLMRQH